MVKREGCQSVLDDWHPSYYDNDKLSGMSFTAMCDLVHESLPQGQQSRALPLTCCANGCIETDYRCILVCSRQNDQFIAYAAAASATIPWLLPYRPSRPIRASP